MSSDNNKLEMILMERNPSLYYANYLQCAEIASPILLQYKNNFPNYTNHSTEHSKVVIENCNYLLSQNNIESLNDDEIYILLTAAFLHDIGMSISESEYINFLQTEEYKNYISKNPNKLKEDVIRDFHHVLSYNFILKEWKTLKIPNKDYAEAIALVAQGHRKVELKEYNPRHTVKTGTEFICLPYLAVILRIADELDITNKRTPELLCKYHTPENEISIMEYEKHKSTYKVHFNEKIVEISAECNNINVYNALLMQINKIQDEITYCQKILSNLTNKKLETSLVSPKIRTNGFVPLNIKFNVDNKHLFETIIGKNLYSSLFVSVRECIQNSIDACRFKQMLHKDNYNPTITIVLNEDQLIIKDNGIGMDAYVLENYFATIGKSFYIHEVKSNPDFKSIGQFGIGAASYFLICDDYDVETKKDSYKAHKFKVSREYDNYFYFLDDVIEVQEGTQISFKLNEEAIKTFNQSYLFSELYKTFKYVEIPITFKCNDGLELISQKRMNEETIQSSFIETFQHYYKGKVGEFSLVNAIVSSETIDAACGLVFKKTETGKCIPFELLSEYNTSEFKAKRNYFMDVNDGPSGINVYHQGVFVKKIKSTNLLRNITGDININKKMSLKLDRNDFGIDEDTNYIFTELNNALLNVISMQLYNNLDVNEKAESSEIIAKEYFTGITGPIVSNKDFINCENFIDNALYVKVLMQDQQCYLYKLSDLLHKYQKFIIADRTPYGKDVTKNRDWTVISKKYDYPIIINNNWDCTGFYFRWMAAKKYDITVVNDDFSSFIIVEHGNSDYMLIDSNFTIPFSEGSKIIATYVGRNMIFNIRNPVINWIISHNISSFNNDIDLKQLYSLIHNLYFEYIFHYGLNPNPKILLTEVNAALHEFNIKHKTNFLATKDWFPSWLQDCIID